MYRTLKYWLQLGQDYGYRRQGIHLWRRWRDPEHDRIECVCCCTDCDVDEGELQCPHGRSENRHARCAASR